MKKINILNIFFVLVFLFQFSFFINECYAGERKAITNNSLKETTNNLGGVILSDGKYAKEIPVFVFHRIVNDELYEERYTSNKWVHSVSDFEERMKMLSDRGYTTIGLDEFYCWYQGKCEFPEKTAMITIDDGDIDLYYEVLPILKKYDLKAVSFLIGDTIEDYSDEYNPEIPDVYMSRELIAKSLKEYPNLEFASHTYGLHHKDKNGKEYAFVKTKEEMEIDFAKEEYDFKYLAYPFGAYTDEMIEVVKENGYRLAFAFRYPNYATREDNPYEVSRIRIEATMDLYEFEKWLK